MADRLVWWRAYDDVTTAIHFEKQLKRWRRDWKVSLIERENPQRGDLYPSMMAPVPEGPALLGPGLSLRENRDDTEI